MKNEAETFLSLFKFNPQLTRKIGVERERFLTKANGMPVPIAKNFLKIIDDSRWTNELSACQVEDRTRPKDSILGIWLEMLKNDRAGNKTAEKMGVKLTAVEVAQANMPFDVFPTLHYKSISKQISQEQLEAACRVAGTHIHIGMTDWEDAIWCHNVLIKWLDYLCEIGDNSCGKRLSLYKVMAKNWMPQRIKNTEHFFSLAKEQGFVSDPRSCYWLIRISVYGTVELRMFGAPTKRKDVIRYIGIIRQILRSEHRKSSPNRSRFSI